MSLSYAQISRMKPQIRADIRAGKVHRPTMAELQDSVFDGPCYAACEYDCYVDPDGCCEHGRPSWLLVLGMI